MHTIMRRFLPHFSAVESDKGKRSTPLCRKRGEGPARHANCYDGSSLSRFWSGRGRRCFFSQTLFNFFFFFSSFLSLLSHVAYYERGGAFCSLSQHSRSALATFMAVPTTTTGSCYDFLCTSFYYMPFFAPFRESRGAT